MPVPQQQIQQAVTQIGGAQPATAGGAVAPTFAPSGNPNTAYNVPTGAPVQSNAAGQWWTPPQGNVVSPLVQSLLNQTYNRPRLPVPTVPVGQAPAPVTAPPSVVPPVIPNPVHAPPGTYGPQNPRGYWEDMGGDGSYCVSADMYLEGGVRASKAVTGLVATTHTPEEGFQLRAIEAVGEAVLQPCVLLITERNAMLVCSVTTPFTVVGAESDNQTIPAPAMKGELVYVKRGKKTRIEKVKEVLDAGEQWVIPISFGGRSFPAGADAKTLIYSHNQRKIPGTGMDLIALREGITSQFGVSWGNSPYITTQSQMPGYVPPTPGAPPATPTTQAPGTPATGTPAPAGTPAVPTFMGPGTIPVTNPQPAPAYRWWDPTTWNWDMGQILDAVTEPFIPGNWYDSQTQQTQIPSLPFFGDDDNGSP